jgi:hypothetical protein
MMQRRHRWTCSALGLPALVVALGLLVACGAGAGRDTSAPAAEEKAPAEQKPAAEAKAAGDENTVTLTAEELAHLGIRTSTLSVAHQTPEVAGYGLVLPRDTLAAAISERSTAQAALAQSRAALARAQEMAGTPGALSIEAQQAAERQAATDEAALSLARSRLAALLGDHPDWGADEAAVLEQLEQGKIRLVRATFPLGALDGALPASLRLGPLGETAASWQAAPVWRAPADPTVPGRSLYALLRSESASNGVSDGEHLSALAAGGSSQTGIVVPLSAVVLHDGHYWCYLQRSATGFTRVQISADAPAEGGYFVTSGLHAGDQVVTQAAGLLLARQTGKADDTD